MRTLMIIKPDWKKRNSLLLRLIKCLYEHNLQVRFMLENKPTRKFWEKFYASHIKKDYFEGMVKYLTSSPSVFIIIEGKEAIKFIRDHVVRTRMDCGKSSRDTENVAHASDSQENAQKEIRLVKKLSLKKNWD